MTVTIKICIAHVVTESLEHHGIAVQVNNVQTGKFLDNT